MKKRKMLSILFIILILVTISSCSKKSDNSKPKLNKEKKTISTIEGFENEIISIMNKVDLVPYYEKQIEEKKKKETEQKGKSGINKKFKPKPVTNNDVLLVEVIESGNIYKPEEKIGGKFPDDIVFVWDEINENINNLHHSWDDLKIELKKFAIPKEAINSSDHTLNSLTISSDNNKRLETIINANKLTSYLPSFIKELNDNKLASIYSMKYYTRQIILDLANNNYTAVSENLNTIKNMEKTLASELPEKKYKDLLDKLIISINNLEDVISLKDINLMKIKAGIIMKNINSIKEKI